MTSQPVPARDRLIARLFWPALLILYLVVQLFVNRGSLEGQAPPITGTLADGGSFSGPELKGRPSLVYFWASWCGICGAMKSSVNSLAEDVPMISVAYLSGTPAEVREYAVKEGFRPAAVVDESGEIGRLYGVRGVPATFILGPDGQVRFSTIGYASELGLRIRLWLADL